MQLEYGICCNQWRRAYLFHTSGRHLRGKTNRMIETAEKFVKDQTIVIECESEPDAVVGLGRPSFLILFHCCFHAPC